MSQPAEYDFAAIEARWQKFWDDHKTFAARTGDPRPKYYVLDMFPYPSGSGLHVGHPEGYTASDILCRYKWSRGFNVLHPMGWDAFGLPAEQYAIQTGTHPAVTTAKNINTFRTQIKSLGFSIDWDREVDTTDPTYFRWTQWIFSRLFKENLAYVDDRPVWFCPALGTVLANEEVNQTAEGPRSDRGNHPCERRPIRQWVLRITKYADRLLDGLKDVDWPDSTKRLQANWIGRSEGAEVLFEIEGLKTEKIKVYTTRPDTLFGATYMVLAPEHPLVNRLTTLAQRPEVNAYIARTASKSDLDRTDLAKEKSGVFTGSYAINPANGEKIPVWIADYVLMGYGTGAIMAVPAHDERDWEFAQQYKLPVIRVIQGPDDTLPYTGDGPLINSAPYNGLNVAESKARVIADLAKRGLGAKAVNYKLRDWLFSRQRYWGEPFPIVWVTKLSYETAISMGGDVAKNLPKEPVTCKDGGETVYALPLPLTQLPLKLPETDSYAPSPTGESPLSLQTKWLKVWVNLRTGETISSTEPRPSGEWVAGTRETNTMPQWAGSCWYYLRYCDPKNPDALISKEAEQYWGVPDFYIGGAEHAVLHLLYARFWHQFLYDQGVVSHKEPFSKLFHQGIILGEDNQKMSKSRGNVVNPDDIVKLYGADTLRVYEMFMGPLEDMKPWNTHNVSGSHRFLRNCWNLIAGEGDGHSAKIVDGHTDSEEILRALHQTIKNLGEKIENLRFNTAISDLMILIKPLAAAEKISLSTARAFVQLVAPFAPHLGEELWSRLGGTASVAHATWPVFDAAKLETSEVTVPVQVLGKLRGELKVSKTATQDEVIALAQANVSVAPWLEGKMIKKIVYVPGKILNFVVG